MTAQDAAAHLGVPYTSLMHLVYNKVLPFVRFPGTRRVWFKRADLERLIEVSTAHEMK